MQTNTSSRNYSTKTKKSLKFLIKNILEKYNILAQ